MIPFAQYRAHDGLGLAELVRSGEASAAELLETAIDAAEADRPEDQRAVAEALRRGARRPRFPRSRRAFRRRALSPEGHLHRDEGDADDAGLAPVRRRAAGRLRFDAHRAVPPGGGRRLRQVDDAGARARALHRDEPDGRDAQPVGPRADRRRIVGRRGGGGRGRHRPARARQRRRRLDPHPRLLLRTVRAEADARPDAGRAARRARAGAGSSSTTFLRARCATAPRCSTRPPGRRRATPITRRLPLGPSSPNWASRRGRCASPCNAARCRAWRSMRSAFARRTRRRRCSKASAIVSRRPRFRGSWEELGHALWVLAASGATLVVRRRLEELGRALDPGARTRRRSRNLGRRRVRRHARRRRLSGRDAEHPSAGPAHGRVPRDLGSRAEPNAGEAARSRSAFCAPTTRTSRPIPARSSSSCRSRRCST